MELIDVILEGRRYDLQLREPWVELEVLWRMIRHSKSDGRFKETKPQQRSTAKFTAPFSNQYDSLIAYVICDRFPLERITIRGYQDVFSCSCTRFLKLRLMAERMPTWTL
jgi:hypothetical protein